MGVIPDEIREEDQHIAKDHYERANQLHVEVHTDTVAEMLDTMADMSEIWKKHRHNQTNIPVELRHALIKLSRNIFVVTQGYDPDQSYVYIDFKLEQNKMNY